MTHNCRTLTLIAKHEKTEFFNDELQVQIKRFMSEWKYVNDIMNGTQFTIINVWEWWSEQVRGTEYEDELTSDSVNPHQSE